MPYTPNPTWADGVGGATPITAAKLNVIEAGIGAAIPKDLVDAKGDLLGGTAADTVGRLAVGSNGKVLTADSTQATGLNWVTPAAAVSYTKTTSKTVNTTVAATDLLNAEVTIAAGVMGTAGLVRLTAWGDCLFNVAGNPSPPRYQLLLGGTTLLDTSACGASQLGAASAIRAAWRITAEILNLGAANSQMSFLVLRQGTAVAFATAGQSAFTTGTGQYYTGGGTANVSFIASAEGVNPSTGVDTATSKTLVLNVINGNAGAGYETKLLGAKVEIVG